MESKIIYHSECACVYPGNCKFRYFSINDVLKDELKTIAICSDFIRQKINEWKYYFKNIRYKKYKNKYRKPVQILNKIDKEYDKEKRELLWNDLMVEILRESASSRKISI